MIGTWIDGKPLYRKVIDFGTLPNNSSKAVAHNVENIDNIYINFGTSYVKNNRDGYRYGLNNTNPSLTGQWQGYVDNSNVYIWAGSDRTGFSAYITIEYTKTTD